MKKDLKGSQLLIIAVIFIVVGWTMNTPIGTLILFAGITFLLFSLARFSAESKAKKQATTNKTDV